MALKNCNICFDKPVFLSGETVTGKVNLTLEKNKLCTALLLNIAGEAYCKISVSHGSGKMRMVIFYTADEVYFETFNNLMAEQFTEVGSSDLIAGNHIFDFKFDLPRALPSSMEGAFGYVKYTAKVILKRKYKIDLCYQTQFTVLSYIDLNMKPRLQNPVQNSLTKKFYFLLAERGILHMSVEIPFSGYVPGQYIPITCNLKNDSKIKVEAVKAALIKEIDYYAKSEQKTETRKVSRNKSVETCCKEEKTYEISLYIPPTPTTGNLNFCRIIDVTYSLQITAIVAGMHGNLTCTFPITIGTIPIFSNVDSPVEIQPSTSRSTTVFMPPASKSTNV